MVYLQRMLKSLQEFFTTVFSPELDQHRAAIDLKLAAAVLMVEVGLADSTIDKEERRVMERTLQESFKLPPGESAAIIRLAEQEADHAVSLHEFTSLLNKSLGTKEKSSIIEILWAVAYADNLLDKYEEYYIRKIADLLYVSHRDYIRAKHLAAEKSDPRA